MNIIKPLECAKCKGKEFTARYETTYVYSYEIDTSNLHHQASGKKALPFLFDNRKQNDCNQYIECKVCGKQYPCSFTMDGEEIDFTILQKAIRSEHTKEPHYWG